MSRHPDRSEERAQPLLHPGSYTDQRNYLRSCSSCMLVCGLRSRGSGSTGVISVITSFSATPCASGYPSSDTRNQTRRYSRVWEQARPNPACLTCVLYQNNNAAITSTNETLPPCKLPTYPCILQDLYISHALWSSSSLSPEMRLPTHRPGCQTVSSSTATTTGANSRAPK